MSTEAFTTLELEAIGDASVDARAQGHQPGTFRRLDDRLTVALCDHCAAAALVITTREERLVTGGSALSYPCSPDTTAPEAS
jgi:hypothetical protein